MKNLPNVKKILKKLNDVDCINYGGCGVSALAIYRYMEKNGILNETTKIIYTYHKDDIDLYNTNQERNKNNTALHAPAHILIQHEGIYFDTIKMSKKIKDFRYNYYYHEATLNELIMSINTGGWNWSFNRGSGVPEIEKIVGVNLTEVDIW